LYFAWAMLGRVGRIHKRGVERGLGDGFSAGGWWGGWGGWGGRLVGSLRRSPGTHLGYLRYLGPVSLPTYAPNVEVMLLFTVLGPYQPPHICSQSRGDAVIYGTWAL
jgi:hypothetical protein